jgi:hypothetical protein
MTDRKKPGVAFWAAVVLVVVLVGYPLSFGPACWLADRQCIPDTVAVRIYSPLAVLLANCCSDSVCDSVTDYGTWGSGRNPGFMVAANLIGMERMKAYGSRHR